MRLFVIIFALSLLALLGTGWAAIRAVRRYGKAGEERLSALGLHRTTPESRDDH